MITVFVVVNIHALIAGVQAQNHQAYATLSDPQMPTCSVRTKQACQRIETHS
jgi:hypothetical protein